MSQNGKESYEFSAFHLNIPERLLTQKGDRIALSDKAFETLCVLVRHAGHLVTKQELMSNVWPDTFVEENNLDKSISALRRALGERNGQEKFIETVRGHGYRFTASVRAVELTPTKQDGISEKINDVTEARLISPKNFPVKKQPTLRRIQAAILVIALLGVLVVWNRFEAGKEKSQKAASRKIESIAVLPLKSLSRDADQEYFADGLTEELITRLARIASLRVISITSVMEYKRLRKPLSEIGKELNVDAILEGSVLQSGNRMRITAQLIHATTDDHLWADSYERELQDILALQNEVASAIAKEIAVTVTPEESAQFTDAPQVNPRAYEPYLRGLYYSDREISEENARLAVQMFQKAVEIDPAFAAAYAQLSMAESFLYFAFDLDPQRLTKSKRALDTAFQLRPGFAEGHLALGCFYYWGHRDYDRALQELATARKRLPNNPKIPALQGAIYRRQRKLQEALAADQKVVELNPRHAMTMFNIAYTCMMMRRYPQAQYYFERSMSLGPDEQNGYFAAAFNQILWKGDLAAARQILNKAPEKKNDRLAAQWFWLEFRDRNWNAALKILSHPHVDPIQKQMRLGFLHRQMGQQKLARDAFNIARDRIREELKLKPSDYSLHNSLGVSLAGVGDKEGAIREGKRAIELLPVSKDAMWGTDQIFGLALIYLMLNESNAAIDQLEYLISVPSTISRELLRVDPRWDPLRDHPRFKKLLEMQRAV
jgi:TolB-like protein/DNA-binding winged helix-turn-helix (wHTH) protein/Flp pilus assembly protein TadD